MPLEWFDHLPCVTRQYEKAKTLVETAQSGNIDFTKAFWNLLDTTPAKHMGKVCSAPDVMFLMIVGVGATHCCQPFAKATCER